MGDGISIHKAPARKNYGKRENFVYIGFIESTERRDNGSGLLSDRPQLLKFVGYSRKLFMIESYEKIENWSEIW